MGKAFTEQEREMVQQRLRAAGLRLFAERGIKKLSVRELAKEAGIAQGGFYSFYESKEAFLTELIQIRVREKLKLLEDRRRETLEDPVGFVIDVFYREGMHLKENKAFNNAISESLHFFMNMDPEGEKRIDGLYRAFLERMLQYWNEAGRCVEADLDGLMNAIRAAGILFSNADLMEEEYFAKIYLAFCQASVRQFLWERTEGHGAACADVAGGDQ